MTSTILEDALRYANAGLRVLPLRPGKKIPLLKDWPSQASTDPEKIRSWWTENPSANIGIATGKSSGIIVLDIDTKEGKKGADHLLELEKKWGKLPLTYEVQTGSGGRHLYFAYPPGLDIPSQKPFSDVEIKSDGSQVVAPPSSCVGSEKGHEIPYQFLKNGYKKDPASLPKKWIQALSGKEGSVPAKHTSLDLEKIHHALFSISPDLPHDEWIRVGLALYAASPDLESLWHEWSGRSRDKYNPKDAASAWKSFSKSRGLITPATLFFIAGSHGWKDSSSSPSPDEPTISSSDESWRSLLIASDKGTLKVNSHNLLLVLRNDKAYQGKIRYDEFSQMSVFQKGSSLDPFLDHSVILLAARLEGAYPWGGAINPKTLDGIIDAVARHNPFHPIKDWLETLSWDGIERMESIFPDYYGSEDSLYNRSVGRNFLIGAVARIYSPGCKLDTMVILEGKQGLKKSSSLKVLFGDQYAMEVKESPESKDFNQTMRGKWCLEFADLDTFSRVEVNRLKAQLTTQTDTYRASFGRRSADYPRQSLFVGTTNEDSYLRDPTGARRYWPVICTYINLDLLASARNQLFAEAVKKFKEGHKWHILDDPKRAEEEQEERYVSDPWENYILPWLARPDVPLRLTTSMILEGVLNVSSEKQDRSSQTRVGSILRRAGYRPAKGFSRPRIYVKTEDT